MTIGPRRSKTPERRCMRLAHWPESDRRLWLAALAPTDPFAGHGGQRARHRAISNRNVVRGYGRWLTFLSLRGALSYTDEPADRITPARLRDYVRELERLGNQASTILARLEELTEMAKVLGRGRNWTFIGRIAARVRAKGAPTSAKRSRLVSSHQLFAVGLQLMEGAITKASPLTDAVAFRDGLMIALLALRSLRLRNLTDLTFGRDLLRTGAGWTIMLPPSATKTHASLEYTWPETLNSALETYLSNHRPVLVARRGRWHGPPGERLWVSADGSPLTQGAVFGRITKWTRSAFGHAVSPHLFRRAAATTLAIHDPAHVRTAAPLLGHRTFSTTERYYVQAQSLEAHRAYSSQIAALRRKLTANTESNS